MNRSMIIVVAALLAGCGEQKDHVSAGETRRAIIYRTKVDHRDHVPVSMSDDKSRITSYPAPSDLRVGDGYPKPTALTRDYLLDNRGIGPNVAYLTLSYEEYAAMAEAPSMKKLELSIIDKDPLLELCDCGRRSEYKDLEKELNGIIERGEVDKRCKRLK